MIFCSNYIKITMYLCACWGPTFSFYLFLFGSSTNIFLFCISGTKPNLSSVDVCVVYTSITACFFFLSSSSFRLRWARRTRISKIDAHFLSCPVLLNEMKWASGKNSSSNSNKHRHWTYKSIIIVIPFNMGTSTTTAAKSTEFFFSVCFFYVGPTCHFFFFF